MCPSATDIRSDSPEPSRYLPLAVLLLLALVTTPVFWLTDLDLRVAAQFYRPGVPPEQAWPGEYAPLWSFFYYGAPLFVGLLGLGTLAALILGYLRPSLGHLRRKAAFVLLTLALGPGLLVNLVFKENWGRPRPRQVEQFAGDMHYLPPLLKGESGTGKSFVAGHASVGFSLVVFWFLWRRRRPRLARVALAGSIGLGLLLGLGRMEAGAHFLSDVLWSGYLSFLAAWLTYYLLLRFPARERAEAGEVRPGNPWMALVYALAAVFLVAGSLANTPVNRVLAFVPGPGPMPPTLRLELDRGDVTVRIGPATDPPLRINGSVHGFGLPNYEIKQYVRRRGGPRPALVYRLHHGGWFAELDTRLVVQVGGQIRRVEVVVAQGDVRVERATDRTPPAGSELAN